MKKTLVLDIECVNLILITLCRKGIFLQKILKNIFQKYKNNPCS